MKKRFTFLLVIAIALLANMSLASGPTMHDWWAEAAAPYAGATIRGVSESTPPSNYVADVLAAQFTELTGINVEFETDLLGSDVFQSHQRHGSQHRHLRLRLY